MPTSDRWVRVVVGDDHPVYRDGVVRALDASDRTEVVAAVGDGRAALDAIREHVPDVSPFIHLDDTRFIPMFVRTDSAAGSR